MLFKEEGLRFRGGDGWFECRLKKFGTGSRNHGFHFSSEPLWVDERGFGFRAWGAE